CFAPGISAISSIRTVERSTMKFCLRRQSFTPPTRKCPSFGEASVYRPTNHFRQRQMIEHRSIKPLIVLLYPTIRMSVVFKLLPLPVIGQPEAFLIVTTGLDELEKFAVRHRQ